MTRVDPRTMSLSLGALALLLGGCADDGPGQLPPEPAGSSSSEDTGDDQPGTTGSSLDQTGDSTTGEAPSREPGGDPEPIPEPEPWVWDLPTGFPVPYVPEDNPMSAAKVELGRHLFYDERLSVNGTTSCATCHQQEFAFTDGLPEGVGATGEHHTRGSMSLANVVYASTLGWGNPEVLSLEDQALAPLFGTAPVEMGLVDEADVIARIADEPRYPELFEQAYPGQAQPMTVTNIVGAIASFERTLISGRSPFDRWFYDYDESAISESAKRGYERFHNQFECFYCHFSFNFSNAVYFESLPSRPTPFHNVGLYNLDQDGAYPTPNTGLYGFTGDPEDMGKFKAPTLRNITVTGPYMHDGSIPTLEGVMEHYAVGGRTIDEGPLAGVGADNPHKDVLMTEFDLTEQSLEDAMALFESLTDEEFLSNPAFSNPWE